MGQVDEESIGMLPSFNKTTANAESMLISSAAVNKFSVVLFTNKSRPKLPPFPSEAGQ